VRLGEHVDQFEDRVAVITGAAHGLGRALAKWCAKEKMQVVLADVDESALAEVRDELKAGGATTLAAQVDVSKSSDVQELARTAVGSLGAVHLLFNNAGVGGGAGDLVGPLWERSLEEWDWVLGVNLWGVIHGVRYFLPIMLAQDSDCHIVNVASGAGLIHGPVLGMYKVSKHGVVSLSETLYFQLARRAPHVKVSVVCPGPLRTNIVKARTDHSGRAAHGPAVDELNSDERADYERFAAWIENDGMSPGDAAGIIFRGIREGRLYIYTHPDIADAARARMDDVVTGRNPAV
jgi:NAD(P)-dependent dehydrogenase (short-subunit alcohol dehydrogenase family)